MPYQLKLLGGALLEDDQGRLPGPISRRHPMGLLALLAATGSRTLSRGKLVGLLWPEVPESRARHRLNTCLYHVRSQLEERVLVSAGDDLRLEPADLSCDVWSFREALASGDPSAAVDLYEGPFLDGFTLDGSAAFEKWLDRERARLRDEYHEALEALAEAAEDDEKPEKAARWWRIRVQEDPYDSRVVGRLMEALTHGGNRAAALRVGEQHVRLLRDEIAAEPGGEVVELLARLRNGTVGPDASPPGATDAPPLRSLAVLPFEVLGGGDRVGSLAEGLHGDLLTELSRVPSLRVISRSSSLRYRESNQRPPEIADELGVRCLVEGDVQQVGPRIRVRVQLSDAGSETQLWAERWDRELTAENLFRIQGELARTIVTALEGELREGEGLSTDETPTQDLEAYRLHASGRTHLEQRTATGMERAAELFRRSIDRDEAYAAAWAGLAEASALRVSYHQAQGEASLDEAEQAARQAIDLAPGSAEGHIALGLIHMVRRRGPRALRCLRTAVRLRPGSARAHSMLAFTLGPIGKWEEGAPHMEQAARLDPMSPEIQFGLAERYTIAETPPDRFLVHARRARELSPAYAEAYLLEGRILTDAGRPDEGLAAIRRGLPLATEATRARHLFSLAHACVAAGRTEEARQALEELIDRDAPFFEGGALAILGDLDGAFSRFGTADWSALHAYHLRYDPALVPIREDARYRGLLDDVDRAWGLEPDGMRDEIRPRTTPRGRSG